MYMGNRVPEIELLIHKVLNAVESIEESNCDCPRAKAMVITKLEEALMWLRYTGRSVPTENQRGIY